MTPHRPPAEHHDPARTRTTFADPGASAREAARRRIENDKWAPEALLPAEAFSDEPASHEDFARLCEPDTPTGRNANAVQLRIMSSCAGWKKRPTAGEFYDAIRAEHPTPRQTGLVRRWGAEATITDLLQAWVQHAYTLRQLVQALHRAHFECSSSIRVINRWKNSP